MVPQESAPEPARAAGRAEPHAARTLRPLRTLRERAPAMVTLVVTAKLNDVDPQVWMAETCNRSPRSFCFQATPPPITTMTGVSEGRNSSI